LVRSILRPLVKIEEAALAVSSRQFPTISPIPRTRELGRVVAAFNTLSSSVRQMLGDSESLAERFRKQTLTDALTGLGNRRSLHANIEQLMESPQGEYALALIQVDGLAELNNSAGHEQGDRFLLAVADALGAIPHAAFIARVQGTTFALLLDSATESELEEELNATRARLESVCVKFGLVGGSRCYAGAVRLFYSDSTSEALAKADESLARSRKFGISAVDCVQSTGMPSGQWKNYLQEAINANRFKLYAQPVIGYSGDHLQQFAQMLHFEIYSRLIDSDGHLIKAARFMPMAMRHSLAGDVDRLCLRNLLQYVGTDRTSGKRYAFNISHEILRDPDFPAWLGKELDKNAIPRSDLILEVSESIVHASPQHARPFAEALTVHGLSFGIDQFGLQKGTVTELAKLHPAYFKLATDLTRNCTEIEEYGEYIAWLVKTSGILGIPVIATCVERKDWLERLVKAGVSGFQGQLIGPVASLENPDDMEQDVT
jgi:diguanylate cyclase (GGDEF)-like protein